MKVINLEFEDVNPKLGRRLIDAFENPIFRILGGEIVFTLPDDQPDVPFSISPISLEDAEGNKITDFKEEFVSDNPAAVEIQVAGNGDLHSGQMHFGAPGLANLRYNVTYRGQIVFSAGAQFTITTGAVGAVTGGDIVFDGITEDPAPQPVPAAARKGKK